MEFANRKTDNGYRETGSYLRFLAPSSINIETTVKTLTYLTGIICFIAIAGQINQLFSVAFISLLLLSLYFEYSKKFYLPRWSLNVLSVAVIAFSLYRLDLGDLVAQIMEALLLLLAIKYLEDKKFRDYMQIYTIVLFLLAGLGLLSLDIVFSVYLLILVILLTTSIVLLTYYSQDPHMELSREMVIKIVLKSMYIPLLAIPLTTVMFVILPRTQFPLLNFLNRAEKAKTGFTDNVRLGAVSGIQEDSSAILRVNMDRIDDNSLYWRGVVLDYFDGIGWKNLHKKNVPMTKPVSVKGKRIAQTVYLEPYDNIYLFALDKPVAVTLRGTRKYDDLTYTSFGFIEKKIKYEVVSIVSDAFDDDRPDKEVYLHVPAGISPAITDLVGRLTTGKTTDQSIDAIFRFLNDGSYKYSLENLPITRTPLDDFLFRHKFGNCEYFASAFAVMLRIAGIPSRLIGGYRGGYYNDVGGYYLVPQKNAHVWVEAYIKEKGWVRIDPTPGSSTLFSSLSKADLMLKISILLDTINYYWFAFVINYNFEKQMNIIFTLRTAFKKPHITWPFTKKKDVNSLLMALIVTALLLTASYAAFKAIHKGPVEKELLSAFLDKVERLGYKKRNTQGLEEFALCIGDEKVRAASLKFVTEFESLYFKDMPFSASDVKRLKTIVKTISNKQP